MLTTGPWSFRLTQSWTPVITKDTDMEIQEPTALPTSVLIDSGWPALLDDLSPWYKRKVGTHSMLSLRPPSQTVTMELKLEGSSWRHRVLITLQAVPAGLPPKTRTVVPLRRTLSFETALALWICSRPTFGVSRILLAGYSVAFLKSVLSECGLIRTNSRGSLHMINKSGSPCQNGLVCTVISTPT